MGGLNRPQRGRLATGGKRVEKGTFDIREPARGVQAAYVTSIARPDQLLAARIKRVDSEQCVSQARCKAPRSGGETALGPTRRRASASRHVQTAYVASQVSTERLQDCSINPPPAAPFRPNSIASEVGVPRGRCRTWVNFRRSRPRHDCRPEPVVEGHLGKWRASGRRFCARSPGRA